MSWKNKVYLFEYKTWTRNKIGKFTCFVNIDKSLTKILTNLKCTGAKVARNCSKHSNVNREIVIWLFKRDYWVSLVLFKELSHSEIHFWISVNRISQFSIFRTLSISFKNGNALVKFD